MCDKLTVFFFTWEHSLHIELHWLKYQKCENENQFDIFMNEQNIFHKFLHLFLTANKIANPKAIVFSNPKAFKVVIIIVFF
jgi:hypothetical protein